MSDEGDDAALLRDLDAAVFLAGFGLPHTDVLAALPPQAIVAFRLVIPAAVADDPVAAFLSLEGWLQRWVMTHRLPPSDRDSATTLALLQAVNDQLKASHQRLSRLGAQLMADLSGPARLRRE